ncbi:MAG: hypothetical protein EB084_07880 [Proteobacteria bacterium]|nr:hypothetical protein [Pseudomonadota bacterium]
MGQRDTRVTPQERDASTLLGRAAPSRRRAFGLAGALAVVGLVTAIAFVVASASVSHLQLSNHALNEAHAQDAARSAISLAIARMMRTSDYGTAAGADRTITVHLPEAPEKSGASLTFDPDQAKKLGVPLSTNNLLGKTSVAVLDGQVVPTQAARLIAVGTCCGVTRQVEAMLHIPPFPYAACCDGAIVSAGGLQVASRDANTPPDTPISKMKPADVLCNAQGKNAIALGPDTIINGDLRAGGGISLDPNGGTRVMGQVLQNQARRTVPTIKAEDYDPGTDATELTATYTSPHFTGKLRSTGNVTILGDTTLDGAVLYVNGDLTINGSLKGTGIIVTTGKLNIVGQADMASADKVAVVAKGDVRIEGRGQSTSRLRGVVYTEGSLVAQQLRLEGALLSHTEGTTSQVRLEQASLLRDPTASRVEVSVKTQTTTTTTLSKSNFDLAIGADGKTYNHWLLSPFEVPDNTSRYYWHHLGVNWSGTTANVTLCKNSVAPNQRNSYINARVGEVSLTADELKNGGGNVDRILGVLNDRLPGSTDPTTYDLAWLQKKMGLSVETRETTTTTGGPTSVVTVDPSELLPLSDRVRIVLWREQ